MRCVYSCIFMISYLFRHINVGSSLNQQFSTFKLTIITCCIERRLSRLKKETTVTENVNELYLTHIGLGIDVSPSLNEDPHHLIMSFLTSPVQ